LISSSSAFYNLPSVNSNRSTSLGRGEKYDFTRNGRGKNPQFYNLPSDFDPKKPHTPSWSFGISRSYYEKVYYESSKFVDKNNPGPGKYNHIKPFGSDAFKFSMFGKGNSKTFSQTAKCPGPGEYPIVSINTKGKYPLSNMKNATTIVFGLSKEKRFTYSCKLDHIITFFFILVNKNPGPNKYDQKSLINGNGFNYVSKYRSSIAKSITGKTRDINDKFPSKNNNLIFFINSSWPWVLPHVF
jgi:hypothetical protein